MTLADRLAEYAANLEFTQLDGLIETKNVTNMLLAWNDNPLTTFPAIDTSSAINMVSTFSGCTNLVLTAPLDLRSIAGGGGSFMLLDSTIDTTIWSDMLIATEANNPNDDVTLDGGNAQYNSSAATSHDTLTVSRS